MVKPTLKGYFEVSNDFLHFFRSSLVFDLLLNIMIYIDDKIDIAGWQVQPCILTSEKDNSTVWVAGCDKGLDFLLYLKD